MTERHTRVEHVTSRQLEVARLVAEGRTNPEIATELGLTLDGAKYHVSELLGRLGLESREEIADWYRSERRGQHLRRFAGLFATVPRAFATAAGAAALTATIALFAIGLSGGLAQDAAAPSAATPAPTQELPSEPGVTPPLGAVGDASDLPEFLDQMRFVLRNRIGGATLEVVSWERIDWLDGCFEIDVPGGCPLSVSPVPGYRVVLTVGADEYVVRTSIDGMRYALEAAPPIAPFETVYEWVGGWMDTATSSRVPCLELKLGEDGAGSIAGCGEAATPVDTAQTGVGMSGFLEHLLQFQDFKREGLLGSTARGSVSTVTLSADGDVPAGDAQRRAAQEWGRFLAIEAYTGHGGASFALALGWQEADEEGCRNAQVEWFGFAYVGNCPGGGGIVILDEQQLTTLYEWLDQYADFAERSADDSTILTLAGSGSTSPTDEQVQEIWDWMAGLAGAANAGG